MDLFGSVPAKLHMLKSDLDREGRASREEVVLTRSHGIRVVPGAGCSIGLVRVNT